MPNCGKRGGPRRCLRHSTGSSHAAPCWPLSRRINVRPNISATITAKTMIRPSRTRIVVPRPVNFRKLLVPCHSDN